VGLLEGSSKLRDHPIVPGVLFGHVGIAGGKEREFILRAHHVPPVINPAPAAADRKAYGRFEIAAQIHCRRGETPVSPASTFTV